MSFQISLSLDEKRTIGIPLFPVDNTINELAIWINRNYTFSPNKPGHYGGEVGHPIHSITFRRQEH